jgi:hypothetical protein
MPVPEKFTRLIEKSLASLPSPLARLIFLTSLRDSYTGRYLHEGWVTVASPEEVNRMLRHIHREVFDSVIRLSLPNFCKELREHFKSIGEVEEKSAKLWLEIEPYREMIPEGCLRAERDFFISEIKAALGVLVHAPDWDILEEPVASPLQQPVRPPPLRWEN